jgi:hypothetical protein
VVEHLSQAFSEVALKLTDPADVRTAVVVLRGRLEETQNSWAPRPLGHAYIAVARNLSDPVVLRAEAAALRALLLSVRERSLNAEVYAEAYAMVAGRSLNALVGQASEVALRELAREILMVASHPFVRDGQALAGALEGVAGRSFDSEIGSAVAWWTNRFNLSPMRLRPAPDGW